VPGFSFFHQLDDQVSSSYAGNIEARKEVIVMRVEVKHIHPKTGLITLMFTAETEVDIKVLKKIHDEHLDGGYGRDHEGRQQLIFNGRATHDET